MSVIGSSDLIGRAPGGRKLIAVVYADMVGYSRLIGLDDIGTLERLRTLRSILIDPAIGEHGGRIVQTGGDSLLIVFDSIDGAVRCSVRVQQQVPVYDGDQPPDRAIRFRVGINIGDVIADGTDLHGEGVNVAARLQAECPPGGICVSRAVRDHAHGRLDLVFDELGPLSFKNIARPVEAFLLRLEPEAIESRLPSLAPLPYPRGKHPKLPRLSVMVAPLRNLGVPKEHEYLVEGIPEDISTDLPQHLGSVVVVSNALCRNGGSASPRDIVRELGGGYVIQGSIRGIVDGLAVNMQLTDVETGAQVWSERFDIDLGSTADAGNEIVGRLVCVLSVKLTEDVNRRIEALPPQVWTPYDLVVRGRAFAFRPLLAANRDDAMRCLEQALDGDPDSIEARLGIASVLINNAADGWSQSAGQDLARAEQLLLGVLNIDCNISWARTAMGLLRRLQGRLDESQIELETALGMAPNNPFTICQLGVTMAFLGHPKSAIPLIERSLRLAPHDPVTPFSHYVLGMCHLLLDHIEEAVIWLRKSRAGNPRLWYAHLNLAAALGLRGELGEAAAALRQAIEIRPEIASLSVLRARPWHINPQFIGLYERTVCAGLRRAGLPDE
jgi:adenylate cyclase